MATIIFDEWISLGHRQLTLTETREQIAVQLSGHTDSPIPRPDTFETEISTDLFVALHAEYGWHMTGEARFFSASTSSWPTMVLSERQDRSVRIALREAHADGHEPRATHLFMSELQARRLIAALDAAAT
jgi:hypothetical protein